MSAFRSPQTFAHNHGDSNEELDIIPDKLFMSSQVTKNQPRSEKVICMK